MIRLGFDEYRDKVYACWIGKSIGGTIGAPYENIRDKLDVKGFQTEKGESIPNDDLDLQLVWLQALEHEGAKNINAYTLGEYWLSFITPYWAEYGIAKSNMRYGIPPAVSGDYNNVWKHSNGAWIRTEIWATTAPLCPDVAAKYAIEDAKVDHGVGEGTVAAAFVASLESAAFAINDVTALLEIALSKIPETSRVYDSVRFVMDAHNQGMTAMDTRDAVIGRNADIADGWFQAPSNIAFVVIGLLWGDGDFKKSMLTAVNCGDDTDCTGATIGAIMGIMYGTAGLPEDWRAHVGDKIVTASINMGISWIPITTCTQLTDKIVDLAPAMLVENFTNVRITEAEPHIPQDIVSEMKNGRGSKELLDSLIPDTFSIRFAYATARVTYVGGPSIFPHSEKKMQIKILNEVKAHGNQPYRLNVKVHLPEGFSTDKEEFSVYVPHWSTLTEAYESDDIELIVKTPEKLPSVCHITLEISCKERYTIGYIPITFISVG